MLKGLEVMEVMEPDINPNNTVQAHLTVPGATTGGSRQRQERGEYVG